MITFRKIGEHGRLGNQMFQYALLAGIRAKTNYDIIFPEGKDQVDVFKYFSIKDIHFFNESDINTETYHEQFFHFDRKVFNVSDRTNFEGYFQTEKYFLHCEDLIRDHLTFKDQYIQEAKEFLLPYQNKQLVSVHIRRTDYLAVQNHHPIIPLSYYKKAMSEFDNNDTMFIVSSDDIEWCKENFQQDNIVFTNKISPVDMCIQSLCNHNIIANSTFSWWGAWLNNKADKVVISPSMWFGPAYFHFDTKDIYCPYFKKMI